MSQSRSGSGLRNLSQYADSRKTSARDDSFVELPGDFPLPFGKQLQCLHVPKLTDSKEPPQHRTAPPLTHR